MRTLLLPLLLLLAGGDAAPPAGWEIALEWLDEEAGRFTKDLGASHALLTARAKEEDPKLLEKLSPEPPGRRPRGYGLLPKLLPDVGPAPVTIREKRYSLETLTTSFTRDVRDAGLLAKRAGRIAAAPLAKMVDDFARLRARQRLMESHLSYHRFWQKSVPEYRAFFERHNGYVEQAKALRELIRNGAGAAEIAAARKRLIDGLAPFRKAPDLKIERRDETLVLPVRMLTDVRDDAFLEAFERAVVSAFSECEAARKLSFGLKLEIEKVAPETLYPGGVPEAGEVFDAKSRADAFPKGAFVLTTGARSTHAFAGRFVQLGTDPARPRVLAHEFGHLLGFTDGYIRGYVGDPDDPYGCVLVEWAGLQDDLMGSPAQGLVTEEMIRRLIEAYGP